MASDDLRLQREPDSAAPPQGFHAAASLCDVLQAKHHQSVETEVVDLLDRNQGRRHGQHEALDAVVDDAVAADGNEVAFLLVSCEIVHGAILGELRWNDPVKAQADTRPARANGSRVTTGPPARATAFATAGASGGTPGSPTPVGAASLGMMNTSTAGIS